jgi:hypothetical protein
MQKKSSIRLTGAWNREGKFGGFVVGTIKVSDLQEALATFGNLEEFELLMSPVREKTSESSPDYNINIRPKYQPKSAEGTSSTGIKKVANRGGFNGGGNKPPVAARTF